VKLVYHGVDGGGDDGDGSVLDSFAAGNLGEAFSWQPSSQSWKYFEVTQTPLTSIPIHIESYTALSNLACVRMPRRQRQFCSSVSPGQPSWLQGVAGSRNLPGLTKLREGRLFAAKAP
jgi:hypothetical protein